MKIYDKPTIYMDSEGNIPCYIEPFSAYTQYHWNNLKKVTSVRKFKEYLFQKTDNPIVLVSFADDELKNELVKKVIQSPCLLKVTGINPNTKHKYVLMLFKHPSRSVKRVK